MISSILGYFALATFGLTILGLIITAVVLGGFLAIVIWVARYFLGPKEVQPQAPVHVVHVRMDQDTTTKGP